MSDTKPFVHGQEGSHSACAERLNKEGGKARCCTCVPHTPCTLRNPTPQTMGETATCPMCGGLGFGVVSDKYPMSDPRNCPICHGTGKVAAEQPECICGQNSAGLPRMDVICPVHDEAPAPPTQVRELVALVDRFARYTWALSYHNFKDATHHQYQAGRDIWLEQLQALITTEANRLAEEREREKE